MSRLDPSYDHDYRVIDEAVKRIKPDVVGVTSTQQTSRDISVLVKTISPPSWSWRGVMSRRS